MLLGMNIEATKRPIRIANRSAPFVAAKDVEFLLVDGLAKPNILRAFQSILNKKEVERTVFGFRILDRLDGADKTLLETWILLFDELGQLGIRGDTPERQDQLPDCGGRHPHQRKGD